MAEPQVAFQIRLPVPQRDKLRTIADIEGTSINDIIRRLVAATPAPVKQPVEED
jgi:hypothetical protein